MDHAGDQPPSSSFFGRDDHDVDEPAATPAPQRTVIAPSPRYVGPDAGVTWGAQERPTQQMQPSPKYVGPDPRVTWSAQEKLTQRVQPSPQYIGPEPSTGSGADQD